MHLRLRAGGETYALPIEDTLEVAEIERLTPVPGAAGTVAGVVNLRGEILPVAVLSDLLGIAPAGSGTIVVVEHDGSRAGLAVTVVEEVVSLPDERQQTDIPHLSASLIADDRLVGVLDVGSLLTAIAGGAT
jgi:purine-binding chemotaxis protein CheW